MSIPEPKEHTFPPLLSQGLADLFQTAIREEVFPGAAVGLSVFNPPSHNVFTAVYGSAALFPEPRALLAETCFDLASLTKPLASTLAILSLIKEKKITLDDRLPLLLEQEIPFDKKGITLRQLLSHSSGLPAWQPYFKKLVALPMEKRKEHLLAMILKEPLGYGPGEKSLYSDLGFMLLGDVVERKSGKRLDDMVRNNIFEPLGLGRGIFYNPMDNPDRNRVYAATENCLWREKVLAGEVHDDNAYAIGGVAGHAGLFGDVGSVLALLGHILTEWQDKSEHPNYWRRDLQAFLARQGVPNSTWALGFDTPSAESSGGRYISPNSIGHLGYTGTSFWIDPERQLIMVLLTNRVHPSRDNSKIKGFRRVFHDRVIELLGLR